MGFVVKFYQEEDKEEISKETFCHNGVIFTAFSLPHEPEKLGSETLIKIEWFDDDHKGREDHNNDNGPTTTGGTLTFFESPPDNFWPRRHGFIMDVGHQAINGTTRSTRTIRFWDWAAEKNFRYVAIDDSVPYTQIRIVGNIGGVTVDLSFKVQVHQVHLRANSVGKYRPHAPYDNPAR